MRLRAQTVIQIIGCISLATLLGGCAGSPVQIWSMNTSQLDEVNIADLCNAYAVSKQSNEDIRAALKRRDDLLVELITAGKPDPFTGNTARSPFTSEEWEAIEARTVFLGMSEFALICSWGYPIPFGGGAINESVGSWGTKRQYVYRRGSYSKPQYVYVENGKVTSWQN